MKNTCECGSHEFVTTITLVIHDVPVRIKPNGDLWYDDLKGDSEGYDTTRDNELTCPKCGHLYSLEQLTDQPGKFTLKDAQPKGV